MPRLYQMSWNGNRRRWLKEYKGKKYAVSCKALGVPETKAESYLAANQWWENKRREIDAGEKPRSPIIDVLEEFKGELLVDQTDLAATMMAFMEAHQDKHLPPGVAEKVLGKARVEELRAGVEKLLDGPQTPPGRTIRENADAWLDLQKALVAAGQVTAARVNNVRMCLDHFVAYLGAAADVAGIDAGKLSGFYARCINQVSSRREGKGGWSVAFAKETFAVARTWIRWLWEQGIIDLPRNITSRSFRFGATAKTIKTWTVAEIQNVIGEAPGKLQLALLLMANCGMTQQDASDLLDIEVDWTAGRIIRKRSKTKYNENVPTVNYKLWPLTWELLQNHRSGMERVLLTESGKPYVRSEMVAGKLVKADGFTSSYAHLKRRLEFTKPMKLLRKTSATLLESHPVYGRFVQHFLGHSPRGVTSKHYAAPSQLLFDEAIQWLGRELGVVKT